MLGRRPAGFSLVEMMVAITVLVVLIAAAGPSTVSWLRAASAQNIAEAAQSGIRRARVEAMKRHRPVTFWLVTDAGTAAVPGSSCALAASSASWVVSLDDPSGRCASAPSADVAPRLIEAAGVPLAHGMGVAATDSDGNPAPSVTFDAFGHRARIGTQIARIDVNHPDPSVRPLRVEVSANGAVRLCDRAVARSGDDPRACTE